MMPREPEQFYPGTTQRVREEPPPAPSMTITEAGDDEPEWASRGKSYPVPGGREVVFYPIGALADALGLSVQTIYKWERMKWLPKPRYRGPVQGNMGGRRRLYTREQIEAIVRVAEECGLLDNTTKPRAETRFPERVREALEGLR